MARHLPTAVVVAVVLGDVVNIVEDQAVPVQVFHGLQEPDVKQHGSVKRLAPTLDTNNMKSLKLETMFKKEIIEQKFDD